MKRISIFPILWLTVMAMLISISSLGQYGPMGIGNSDGSAGQPKLVFWLDGSSASGSDGQLVSTWSDRSGNDNHFTSAGSDRPIKRTNGPKGKAYLEFDNDKMVRPNLDFPTDGFSIYIVYRSNDSDYGLFSYAQDNSNPMAAVIRDFSAHDFIVDSNFFDTPIPGLANGNWRLAGYVWDNSSNPTRFFWDHGACEATSNGVHSGESVNSGGTAVIGQIQHALDGGYDVTEAFQGDIAEIFLYDGKVNKAGTRMMTTYIDSRYEAVNVTGGWDKFNTDDPYRERVVGIGRDNGSGSEHLEGRSDGLVLRANPGGFNGSYAYLSAAHSQQESTQTSIISADVSSPAVARWNRDWLINKQGWGSGTSAFVAFDFGEGVGGEFPLNIDNYRLLRWNGSSYAPVSVVDQFIQDDEVVFRVNNSFNNGRYTIGTTDQVLSPLDGQESRTWYAYQTGDWSDPGIWTLDGSAAPYYHNPDDQIPGSGDIVVINSGRTVTSDIDNINLLQLRCRGVLDLAQTSGHNVGDLIGNGRIRCAGNGGQDNFPSGNTSAFADPVNGGVLEFYGSTGFNLTKSLEVNDLIINMASSSDVVTVNGDQTINGDFTINSGNWQFNDGSSRTVITHGDVLVESNGLISTGGSNVQHTWTFHGDLRNQGGDVRFTERTMPDYNDNGGTAWVNCRFVHDSKNQEIVCNGISHFQRIVMDKGTDDTYLLSIEASDSDNFKLLGRADDDMGDNPYQNENVNSNCLAIINGTAEIRENVFIPLHTGGGNYNINETAGLWVNGGEVTKGVPIGANSQAIVVYGKIRISAGTLNANCKSGITTRTLGSLEISGGTLHANQIRTSVFGPDNIGSVSLSGGLIDLDGSRSGGTNGGYYVFSLTYSGNVFEMTGGELRVAGANGSGLIFINSDQENISVTGGKVVARVENSSGNHRVTTRAPFWNFTVENPSTPSEKVVVSGGDSDGNPIPDLPLTVKGKLTLDAGSTLDMSDLDLFIGGDLEFVNGATYEHGNNRTVFNGPGSSQLEFGSDPQWSFNDFVIEKDQANREVEIVAGDGNATIEVEDLHVLSGEFILNSYEAFANGDVINNGTIGQEDDSGALHFTGSSEQTINAAGGIFYKVNLDNSAGAVVESGQMTIRDNFDFSSGNLNVGGNDLRLEGENATITGYDSDEMVLCDGGGIEHYVKQNGQQITYPLGTLDGATPKYTPAILQINSFSDDGYVRIAPVADTLDLAVPPGPPDILGYYWAVSHSGFGSLPSVAYRFDYDQSDVGGDEADYAAGKVLNEPNFNRSFLSANVDISANQIFINNGSGQNLSDGIPIENAFYSAGHQDRFTGQIRVYYSRNAGEGADWTNPANWNRSDLLTNVNPPGSIGPEDWHSTSQTASPDAPGPGDLVYIGFTPHDDPGGGVPHSYSAPGGGIESVAVKFTPYTDAAGNPTSEYQGGSTTQRRPTLQVSSSTDLGNLNRISGEGCLLVNDFDVDFTGVDLNDFLAQDSSIVFYTTTAGSGSPRVIQNVPSNVPNLYVTANASGFRYITLTQSISVRNNLKLEDGGGLILNGGAAGDISVQNDLLLQELNGLNGGRLYYPNGNLRTVSIMGDLRLDGNGSLIDVNSPNSPAASHVLRIQGDIHQNTSGTSGLALFNGANNDFVNLELAGPGTNEFTNDGGPVPSLYRMVVDKGTGISSGFTFNTDIDLNGPTNQPNKAIALRNGLLTLNHSGINITLSSGGGDFTIPSTSGLQLDAGYLDITGSSTGMILDGLLRLNGGQIAIDDGNEGSDNYLEYSASGSAVIELNGGTLKVGSQLRRGLTSSQGVLQYEQSGGMLQVGLNAAPNLNRGVFEIVNTNSRFEHTGGTIEIVRGINSSNTPSLLLETSDYELSSSAEIQIGNGSTPSGAQSQQIGIKSNIPLKTLRIDNSSGNDPFVRLISYPLTVEELLEIDTDATFDCNEFDLTLLQDIANDGVFESSGAHFILEHSTSAQVGGNGTYNIAYLDKYGSGTTTVTTDLEIGEDLLLDEGMMNFGSNSCLLNGDATIDGDLNFTTSSFGLAFTGDEEQRLKRSSPGVSNVDIITIDNVQDVLVHPEGAGYEFVVNGDLRMVKGVFDLQGNLLELGLNANFVPVNGFGPSNMISTGGSFVPYGVKKQIPANTTSDYFVPLGFDTRFTPVRMNFSAGPDFSSGDQNCELLVRATEQPVSVLKSGQEGNALQLFYTLEANNVGNGFKADAEFIYDDYYVSTISPDTESDYAAARVLRPVPSDETQDQINIFGSSDVDEGLNLIRFELYNTTEQGINGDYFAAVEDAILEDIASFETIDGGGPASDGAPNPNGTYDSGVLGGGAPTGAIVRVKSGHTLNLDINGINFYRTIIETGAVVEIPSTTTGHRLGIVTGEGTIRLEGHGTIPAGTFNQFFNCTTGGTLEFAGSADYDIMGGLPTVRNLSLRGSGERRVANNDFTVCEELLIEGTPSLEVINQNNRHITTHTLNLVQGLLDTRDGDLTVEDDFTMQGGSFTAGNNGVREVLGDLIIDNGNFYVGDGGSVELKQDMTRNGGSVDGGGPDARIVFNGTTAQEITGSLTGSNMLSALEIDNPAGLTLNDPVDLERKLFLTEGRIFTNPSAMLRFVETNLSVEPEKGSTTSFVEGPMQWELGTNPTQRYFPVGRESWHRPFAIYSASVPRTWTVEYFNINPLSTSEVTSDLPADQVVVETVSIREYWRVNSNTSSSTTARISLSWGDSSIVSDIPAEYDKLVVLGWDDGNGNWANYGGVEHGAWSPPNDVSEFNSENPVPFTERILTLGSRDVANPLPVEFLYFRGEKHGELNRLSWATATETNNEKFVIERSLDGVHFNAIGEVNGAGNSSNMSNYNFYDDSPPQQVAYYRLKQVDFDGKEKYAGNIVVIERGEMSSTLGGVFYPNPARNGELKLELTGSDGRSSVVSFVDVSGRVMERHIIQPVEARSQTISFNTQLPAGVYVVEVRNSKTRFTSRVIIR